MDARTISHVIRTLQREAPSWRPTALTVVQQEDRDPFAILVGCLLSLRTKDETTLPAARRLLARARTPVA
ncbi:MAG: endonuclease III, partial [Deltaproteobacteria bacterium]|nr:endonuclease III [Deltaproteobacteria bacterium]